MYKIRGNFEWVLPEKKKVQFDPNEKGRFIILNRSPPKIQEEILFV